MTHRWPIMVGQAGAMPTTSTRYLNPQSAQDSTIQTNILNALVAAPCAMTLQRLFVNLGVGPGGSGSETFSLVDSSGTKKITTEALSGAMTDAEDDGLETWTLAQGDRFAFDREVSGSITATPPTHFAYYVDADLFPMFAHAQGGAVSASADSFAGLQDGSGFATASTRNNVFPDAGKIKNLTVYTNTILTAGSYTITLMRAPANDPTNFAATALTVTVDTSGQLFTDNTHEVTVAPGDMLNWKISPSGTPAPTINRMSIACAFQSDTPGNGVLLGGVSTSPLAPGYHEWNGAEAWNASENVEVALAGECAISKIVMRAGTQVGAGNSRILTLRTGPLASRVDAATITLGGAGAVYAEQDVDVALTEATDLVSVQHTITGSPNAGGVRFGFVYSIPAAAPSVGQGRSDTVADAHGQGIAIHARHGRSDVVNDAIGQPIALLFGHGRSDVVNDAIGHTPAVIARGGRADTVIDSRARYHTFEWSIPKSGRADSVEWAYGIPIVDIVASGRADTVADASGFYARTGVYQQSGRADTVDDAPGWFQETLRGTGRADTVADATGTGHVRSAPPTGNTLPEVMPRLAAIIGPSDDSEPPVYESLVDAIGSVPCLMLEWADSWIEEPRVRNAVALPVVICIAGRLDVEGGARILAEMTSLVLHKLRSTPTSPFAIGPMTRPQLLEVAGVSYLSARIQLRMPIKF